MSSEVGGPQTIPVFGDLETALRRMKGRANGPSAAEGAAVAGLLRTVRGWIV
jgi:hypothetical protein